jgi:hypothetical protein
VEPTLAGKYKIDTFIQASQIVVNAGRHPFQLHHNIFTIQFKDLIECSFSQEIDHRKHTQFIMCHDPDHYPEGRRKC